MKYKGIVCSLFLLLIVFNVQAQEINHFNKLSSGFEIGTWTPNNLRNSENLFDFKFSRENLYSGIFFTIPLKNSLFFRITGAYYKYVKNDQAIILLPFLFDIKYTLISVSKIAPYVSYGFGAYLGHHNKFSYNFKKDKLGLGLNFGTGFDFLVLPNWVVGFEFRYHYLRFSKVFVFTDDYSGLKINFALYHFF